jgi:ATP-dependent exoDNAse (exonuclease V) beta subunit
VPCARGALRTGIRLFAVGDPDQSIYGFTGANPALFRSLSEREALTAFICGLTTAADPRS